MRISKLDFICVLLLLSVTIISRLLLIMNAPFLYAQDAYLYISEARDIASGGTIQFRTGLPFVLCLGASLKILGPIFGDIVASRLFTIITSSLLVISIYLLGLKMSGRLLGLSAGLIATLEPYFLEYSTVPYTEAFAILMGLLALYFGTSDRKLQTILSPIFFYLAVSTRPELYLALLIPILILFFYKRLKTRPKQGVTARLVAGFVLAILVYLLPFMSLYRLGLSWGDIGIVERFALFLKPELLRITVESSFSFYDRQFLNQAIYLLVGLGIALAFLNIIAKAKSRKAGKTFSNPTLVRGERSEGTRTRVKSDLFSDNVMIALCLFLFFAFYLVVVTVLAYRYNWAFYVAPSDRANLDILSKAIIVIPRLHERYLILPRLLISYPLGCALSVVAQRTYAEIGRKPGSKSRRAYTRMSHIRQLLAKISATEEIRKRRSDPEFRDFQRYVTDMRYVLKALKGKRKVLDIGAGAGVFSVALAHLGHDVTATNLVIEAKPEIDFFRKFGCRFVSVNLDNQKMPLPNEEFDAVLFCHVVEHLEKPLVALMEIRRVLKPGGKLILMTPNGAITSIYKRLSLQASKSIQNRSHFREYNVTELTDMLTTSGFEILNIEYSNKMVLTSLLNTKHQLKKLLGYGYCFFSKVIPAISYEIHITAQAKNPNTEVSAEFVRQE